jgi:hypothetical protein
MLPFNEDIIQRVWERAYLVAGKDPALYRQDKCGALIRRDFFGRASEGCSMGWVIDHIKPLIKGGTNDISNLQALQWENNRNKKDNEFLWSCRVTYSLDGNTYLVQEQEQA